MNLFAFWKNENGGKDGDLSGFAPNLSFPLSFSLSEKELVTAPLDGTILPGVTRDSVLGLARKWGEFKITERPFTMKEIVKAVKENRVSSDSFFFSSDPFSC